MEEKKEKDTINSDEESNKNVEEKNIEDEETISTEENETNGITDDNVEKEKQEDSDKLLQEIDTLSQENEKITDRLLRLQAEFDNYRKRTEKEKIAERKYKAQDLAVELLPIIDNFERALQTEVSDENKGFKEGMQMVYNQLQEALKSQGIEQMDTVHKEFDPNLHHAVMQVEDDAFESNIVVEELQKGFMLKDKVIRPAMVKVNK